MSFVPSRVAFVLVLATLVPVWAEQDVVFRTSVDLVTVDATVLGRDGNPLPGLGPDDFVLKVDGRPRQIVSSQFIAQAAPAVRQTLAARHFTSNEHGDAGRFVVLAVDEAHIRRLEGRPAVTAASGFIDRLDPLDRVAIVPLSRVGVIQFTRDRADAKRRLLGLRGQTDPVFLQFNIGLSEAVEIADGGRARLADVVLRECGRSLSTYTSPQRTAETGGADRDGCPEQVEQESRAISQHARTQARISLSALEALVAGLKPLDGPKTVVLLSEGMVLDPRLVDITELAAAAKDARVSIYVLHMEVPTFEAAQDRVSPTFLRDAQMRGDGLARLAGATRGAVFRLVGSDAQPFERIAREISGYYLLAFEAIDGDRDGRVHTVAVALTRGGGQLRARSAFRMAPVLPSAGTRQQHLVDLLRGSRAATELPVRVATYTYAEPGSPQLRVVVSTEADAAEGPASQVLLGYVLTDSAGVIAASGAHQSVGGRHAFSAVVAPGKYTLRVAGIDPLERHGLVERPFAAAVESPGGIGLSDLILAPIPATPDAPLQPLVDRITDRTVTAYIEVYAGTAQPLPEARVIFDVAAETGGLTRVSVPTALVRRNERWAIARAELPLSNLGAGRYVAHARVVVDGKDSGRVMRPFSYDPR